MKKILVIGVLLGLGVVCFAEDKMHNFQVAYEMSNYKYSEPKVMNLKAMPKYGFSLQYMRRSVLSREWLEEDPSFAILDFRYMIGDVDYKGALLDGTPLSVSNLKDYYIELGLRLGKEYDLGLAWRIAPYFGLGYRRLTNHLEEAGTIGYLRESRYVYMPFGMNLRYTTEYGTNVMLNTEIDWLLRGSQYSGVMHDALIIGSDTYDLAGNRNKQDQGYGLRTSLKLEKSWEKIGLFVEPFIRYWHIQNSNIEAKEIVGTGLALDGFYEPKNWTYEYGLKAGITF